MVATAMKISRHQDGSIDLNLNEREFALIQACMGYLALIMRPSQFHTLFGPDQEAGRQIAEAMARFKPNNPGTA